MQGPLRAAWPASLTLAACLAVATPAAADAPPPPAPPAGPAAAQAEPDSSGAVRNSALAFTRTPFFGGMNNLPVTHDQGAFPVVALDDPAEFDPRPGAAGAAQSPPPPGEKTRPRPEGGGREHGGEDARAPGGRTVFFDDGTEPGGESRERIYLRLEEDGREYGEEDARAPARDARTPESSAGEPAERMYLRLEDDGREFGDAPPASRGSGGARSGYGQARPPSANVPAAPSLTGPSSPTEPSSAVEPPSPSSPTGLSSSAVEPPPPSASATGPSSSAVEPSSSATGQAGRGASPPEGRAAGAEPERGAGGAPSALASPGRPVDGLDVDQMEEALRPDDGEEVALGGSLYVWRDNYLYRRDADGKLEPTGSFLGPNDISRDADGRQWLSQESDGGYLIQVALRVWATVNFEHDSDVLARDSIPVLDTFGQALRRPALAGKKLLIIGHADDTGPEDYNLELSRRRAASVGRWLVGQGGLEPDRLILSGHGEESPVASNETDEGRALNRRVEFVLLQ